MKQRTPSLLGATLAAVLSAVAVCSLLVPVTAVAAPRMIPAVRFEFTDCAAAGSSAQTLTGNGTIYAFRVTDENTWICYAATCASPNGEKWPAGTVIYIEIKDVAGQQVSCRSTGSTGDAIFTQFVF